MRTMHVPTYKRLSTSTLRALSRACVHTKHPPKREQSNRSVEKSGQKRRKKRTPRVVHHYRSSFASPPLFSLVAFRSTFATYKPRLSPSTSFFFFFVFLFFSLPATVVTLALSPTRVVCLPWRVICPFPVANAHHSTPPPPVPALRDCFNTPMGRTVTQFHHHRWWNIDTTI